MEELLPHIRLGDIMAKFEIVYKYENYPAVVRTIKNIEKFPDATAIYATTAKIIIYFSGELRVYAGKKNEIASKKLVFYDWLWDICDSLSKLHKLNSNETQFFSSSDNPFRMSFVKEHNKVKIHFSGTVKGTIFVEYKELLTEIDKLLNTFTNELLQINSKINDDDQFKEILVGKEKIKKILNTGFS